MLTLGPEAVGSVLSDVVRFQMAVGIVKTEQVSCLSLSPDSGSSQPQLGIGRTPQRRHPIREVFSERASMESPR